MRNSKKIAIFGAKKTTQTIIENLHSRHPISHLITLNPEGGQKHDVADYADLSAWSKEQGITPYQVKSYSLKNKEDQDYIQGLQLDCAFVIGWQRLIPKEILTSISTGAFGMHGSALNLPLGRGRSPMNWSLIEGRKVFYTNLFKYDPGVDSGDIVDTFKFQITERDTAETLHFKNTLAMRHLLLKNLAMLLQGEFKLTGQPSHLTPTYYPKRSPSDSLIDWENDIIVVERFIRAVTKPFNGAYTYVNGRRLIIWESQVFDHQDFGYSEEKHGTILEVFPSGKFLVRCFGGLLLVNSASFLPEKGQRFDNGSEAIHQHRRNRFGFFDLPEDEAGHQP